MVPFTLRYSKALADGTLVVQQIEGRLARRLNGLLGEFDEGGYVQKSRYDNWQDYWPTSHFVLDRLNNTHETHFTELDEFRSCSTSAQMMDLLEFWYDELSDGEKIDFQRELNEILRDEGFPWRFSDGCAFLLDSNFLQQEVVRPALEIMVNEPFAGAKDEFTEALKDLTAGDTKGAIHNSCKSLESALKATLGLETGTASTLLRAFCEQGYLDDLPDSVQSGVVESVLMSLPFLRNKLGGHGQGESVVEAPKDCAQLAVNIAAAFNRFVIGRYLVRHPGRESEVSDSDEFDIPF